MKPIASTYHLTKYQSSHVYVLDSTYCFVLVLLLLCCRKSVLLFSPQWKQGCHQHQHTTILLLFIVVLTPIPVPSSPLAPLPSISLLPDTATTAMSPITVSCLRCTDLGYVCVHHRGQLCNQCDAAGLDSCVFPPSIRHHQRSKAACTSCIHRRRRCTFYDDNNTECTHCIRRGLPCVFELNGE